MSTQPVFASNASRHHAKQFAALLFAMSFAIATTQLSVPQAFAQQTPAPPPLPPPGQALTPDQLDDLVAPIALYPDELVSQIMVAATYPLEVVEAYQFVQQNPNLKGPELTQDAQQQNWDPSVQALVLFPDVLKQLNSDVTWTTNLGNAFLAQQQDVMSAVQTMRQRAQQNGKLQTTQQETVTDSGGYVDIEPSDPDVIYVPVYNPAWIWGPPLWYPYPSWYWPAPGFYGPGVYFGWGAGINMGFYFGTGWHGWHGWGWHPGWGAHTVVVNNTFIHEHGFNTRGLNEAHGTSTWAHDPAHRGGVPYANPQLNQQFRGNVRQAVSPRAMPEAARTPAGAANERIGNRQMPANQPAQRQNRSAFSGQENGAAATTHAEHGFSSMGPARSAPAPAPRMAAPAPSARARAQNVCASAQNVLATAGAQRRRPTVMKNATIFFTLILASAAALNAQQPAEKTFATPQQAVQALVDAAAKNDTAALMTLFGPRGTDIVQSGDTAEDTASRANFVNRVHEKMNVSIEPSNPGRATLIAGNDNWPFPVPLIRTKSGQWYFDSARGRTEILARRIGRNELVAIDVCRGYVEAQMNYSSKDYDKDGILQYAQRLISTPGKKDGLYFEGEPANLIPKDFADAADAIAAGRPSGKRTPYHGYYFHVLKAQGPEATGGAHSYIVKGEMIGGFGLIAYPAQYGVSGIKSFIVNQNGVVYEKDLGPMTATLARQTVQFNPGKGWEAIHGE